MLTFEPWAWEFIFIRSFWREMTNGNQHSLHTIVVLFEGRRQTLTLLYICKTILNAIHVAHVPLSILFINSWTVHCGLTSRRTRCFMFLCSNERINLIVTVTELVTSKPRLPYLPVMFSLIIIFLLLRPKDDRNRVHYRLKYIHIEKGLLFLVTTLVYLNRIQHVSYHSIADARAVLPASSK